MNTAEEITVLKAEIEGYTREYNSATTPEDRRGLLLQAITASRQVLHDLLASLAPAPAPYAGNYFSSCWSSNQIISHHFHVITG